MAADFNPFALSRFCLSTPLFAMQILTVRLFLCHAEFRFTCFRLLLLISLCDSFQLFIQGIVPLLVFVHNFFEHWQWLEKLCGALLQSTYTSLFWLNLVLALNRLCVVVKTHILRELGDAEPTWERRVNRLLYIVVAFYFACISSLFCSPWLGVRFVREYYVWSNDMNTSWMETELFVEMHFLNNAFPIATIAVYLAIFAIIKWKSAELLTLQHSDGVAKRKRATQLRILLQCALQFVVFQIPAIYFVTGYNPGKTTLQRTGIVSILMVLICGVNPFIHLAMLPNFRPKFVDDVTSGIWCCRERKPNGVPERSSLIPSANAHLNVTTKNWANCTME